MDVDAQLIGNVFLTLISALTHKLATSVKFSLLQTMYQEPVHVRQTAVSINAYQKNAHLLPDSNLVCPQYEEKSPLMLKVTLTVVVQCTCVNANLMLIYKVNVLNGIMNVNQIT